jgi:ankyrin repeat protein
MKTRLGAVLKVAVALLFASVPGAFAQLNLNPFNEYYNNIPRAAQANDVGKIRSLLSNGYSPNQTDENGGTTGMHIAAASGNLQIIAILFKAGANINQRDNLGSTPLHYAAEHDHIDAVQLLLDMKANVDAENKNGMTALMFAAKTGDPETIRALLAHGANPNQTDFTGRDAAGWAIESHRQAVIELLRSATAHKH